MSAMDDDFGTPRALSWLFAIASEINQAVSKGLDSEVVEHRKLLKELANILGLTFRLSRAKPLDAKLFAQINASIYRELNRSDAPDEKQGAEKIIENLIELRNELRKEKQWQLADKIRAKLGELGIALEDTPQGTVWKRKR